jgi:hypothetical protein
MMPPVSYSEFHVQLLGARTYDQEHPGALRLEEWLWESFAFADHGAIYQRWQLPDDQNARHFNFFRGPVFV